MRPRLAVLSMLVLAGCGPDRDALWAEWNGVWEGTTTLELHGSAPVSYPGMLDITAEGSRAIVSHVCPLPGDPATITAFGAEKAASWSGSVECQPLRFSDCAAVVFTFANAFATLNANGTLSGQGSGTGAGCGTSRAFTFRFAGRKR